MISSVHFLWFCDSTFKHRRIKCKAYNACQLLQFTVEVYSKYFESRILNVVLN